MEIAVRAYTRLQKESPKYDRPGYVQPDYRRILVFDTETRDDEKQALTFGSFVIYNDGAIEQIGLFYDIKSITNGEFQILKDYCDKDHTIRLYSLTDFIEKVFYPEVYKNRVPCIAYNMPFDLSRIAMRFGYARGKMSGGFTLTLSKAKKHPPIIIKQGNSDSLVKFQSTSFNGFKGNFIDCQTIAKTLTDRKHITLAYAAKKFNKKRFKIDIEGHGKVTRQYIEYNINDTLTTAELFTKLKAEYEKYEIPLPLTQVHSSASMGKAMLESLGIRPFMEQNPNFPPQLLAKVAQAYYGGRCEDRIRKLIQKVAVLDFSSMYPTLFILLGLYDLLVAEKIEYFDDTENVREFLQKLTRDDLKNPEIWKSIQVIVELEPDNDLVPVRAAYNPDSLTVGLNRLTSKETVWYGLPSIALDKLLTGKIPKIKSAIRFKSVGRQKSLRNARVLGIDIDPRKDNPFRILVEEKEKTKKFDKDKSDAIKILVNATAYGIFMELNREPKKSKILVYTGNGVFATKNRFEKEGRYYNPILATLITDGAKLLLGIGDLILQDHNEVMAYTDTDRMFIPSKYQDEIIGFYGSLNPYKNIEHLLKLQADNMLLYALSAKRYVLFKMDERGDVKINDEEGKEDYSLHGLGHLTNPFDPKIKNWQKRIWEDILALEFGKVDTDSLFDSYRSSYAISQFTVSTKSLMERFAILNKGKEYRDCIKPFNFFLLAFGTVDGVKPIAPLRKNPQTMPFSDFINYKDGKMMKGMEYFKDMAEELSAYINHLEAKLEGDVGILQRKQIFADRKIYIGKEADKIEENMTGIGNMDYNFYTDQNELRTIFLGSWKDAKKYGISRRQFYRIKRQIKEGSTTSLKSKTLSKLNR